MTNTKKLYIFTAIITFIILVSIGVGRSYKKEAERVAKQKVYTPPQTVVTIDKLDDLIGVDINSLQDSFQPRASYTEGPDSPLDFWVYNMNSPTAPIVITYDRKTNKVIGVKIGFHTKWNVNKAALSN